MSECIDVHTHVVPENFPPYAGKNRASHQAMVEAIARVTGTGRPQ